VGLGKKNIEIHKKLGILLMINKKLHLKLKKIKELLGKEENLLYLEL
jgi:hypothetical protein